MTKCNCDLCKRSRKFKKIMRQIATPWRKNLYSWIDNKEEMVKNIKWLEDLYSHLMDIEESHDILKLQYDVLSEKTGYKAYLDGTVEKISKDRILIDGNLADPDDWICIVGSQEDNAKPDNS